MIGMWHECGSKEPPYVDGTVSGEIITSDARFSSSTIIWNLRHVRSKIPDRKQDPYIIRPNPENSSKFSKQTVISRDQTRQWIKNPQNSRNEWVAVPTL
jgi:hypothetical protein